MGNPYIRIDTTTRSKPTFTMMFGTGRQAVSMGKAYKSYCKGCNLQVYNNRMHVGTYPSKFGAKEPSEIAKLAFTDSVNHDFKGANVQKLCAKAWKVSGIVDFQGKILTEADIKKEIFSGGAIQQKSITYYGGTGVPQFWKNPPILSKDASPIGMPFCRPSNSRARPHNPKTESSWKPVNRLLNNGLTMFTLTDSQGTSATLAENYIASKLGTKKIPVNGVTTRNMPIDMTFSLTGKVRYTLEKYGVHMLFSKIPNEEFDTWFGNVYVYFGSFPPPFSNARPWKIGNRNKFGNCQIWAGSDNKPIHITCKNRGPSKEELSQIILALVASVSQTMDAVMARRICRLMEIKRLGDWGQVYATTFTPGLNLVTKDQPAYYYAHLLQKNVPAVKPKVAITQGSINPLVKNVSKSIGIDIAPTPCAPYPDYTAAPAPPRPPKLSYYYTLADKANNQAGDIGLYMNKWYTMTWDKIKYYVMFMTYETEFYEVKTQKGKGGRTKVKPTEIDQKVRYINKSKEEYDGKTIAIRGEGSTLSFRVKWDSFAPPEVGVMDYVKAAKLQLMTLGKSMYPRKVEGNKDRMSYNYVSFDEQGYFYRTPDGTSFSEQDNRVVENNMLPLSDILGEVDSTQQFKNWTKNKKKWTIEHEAFFDSMVRQIEMVNSGEVIGRKELKTKKYVTAWAAMLRKLSDATGDFSSEEEDPQDMEMSSFGRRTPRTPRKTGPIRKNIQRKVGPVRNYKRRKTRRQRTLAAFRGLTVDNLVENVVSDIENGAVQDYDPGFLLTVVDFYSDYIFDPSYISIEFKNSTMEYIDRRPNGAKVTATARAFPLKRRRPSPTTRSPTRSPPRNRTRGSRDVTPRRGDKRRKKYGSII